MSQLHGVFDHELKGTLEERLRIVMQGDPALYHAQLHEKREAKVDAKDSVHHRGIDSINDNSEHDTDAAHTVGLANTARAFNDNEPRPFSTRPRTTYTVKNTGPLVRNMFRLKFDGVERSLGAHGAEQYTVAANAKIFAERPWSYSLWNAPQDLDDDDDEEWEQEVQIGHISATIVQASRAMNTGKIMWDICDGESQELADMYRALFTKDGELRPEFEELVQYDFGDICYINEIFLEKKYRGYGTGLLAIDGLIKSLPSMEMDCFMLRAASVNEEAANDLAGSVAASERLSDYYRLMGFEVWKQYPPGRLPPLMGLCTKFTRPDITKVVPHLCS